MLSSQLLYSLCFSYSLLLYVILQETHENLHGDATEERITRQLQPVTFCLQ
jgi:hypothetical protein